MKIGVVTNYDLSAFMLKSSRDGPICVHTVGSHHMRVLLRDRLFFDITFRWKEEQLQRSDIFIVPKPNESLSPGGATSSDDVASERSLGILLGRYYYKDVSPAGFTTFVPFAFFACHVPRGG
jgi:hypothetical protein